MRWQRTAVRAVNQTRGAVLGDAIRVADTMMTRIVGLLGEQELAAGDGLLIVPSQGVHTWGMRFPIDVVVLDGQWKVIATHRAMRSFRVTRMYWKGAAVLELPAGTIDASSTAVGDELDFHRIERTDMRSADVTH